MPDATHPLPRPFHALVLKSGVSLGGLSDDDRTWALAVAALRLEAGVECTEAQANDALKGCLQHEGSFLQTDHVELRRWLVDTGWWVRDGYGRAYRRRHLGELSEPLRAIAQALSGWDVAAWILSQRVAAQHAREARRQAWEARQTGLKEESPPSPASTAMPQRPTQIDRGRI